MHFETDMPQIYNLIQDQKLADPADCDCGNNHPGNITPLGIDILTALTACFVWNGQDGDQHTLGATSALCEAIRDFAEAALRRVTESIAQDN